MVNDVGTEASNDKEFETLDVFISKKYALKERQGEVMDYCDESSSRMQTSLRKFLNRKTRIIVKDAVVIFCSQDIWKI